MKKILFLLTTAIFMLMIPEAQAAGSRGLPQENYTKPSKATDVGMIFYKLVGATPPFASWIETSTAYKAMTAKDQALFKAAEMARLEQRYAAVNLKKDAITIRTVLKVQVISKPAASPGQPAKQALRLDLPPDVDIFFPYTVGTQTIAVIPNGIELYREIPLTAAEAAAIKGRIDVTGQVTLVLEIAPKMADATQPMILGGISQWLLSGEIGFFGLYNNYADVLWSYQAPSYVMQGQDNLLKLKSNSLVPSKPAPQGVK